jgi:hypothetical protein
MLAGNKHHLTLGSARTRIEKCLSTYPNNQEATFFVVKNYVFYNKKSELSDF